MPYKDPEKKKENDRRYATLNKEKGNANKMAWKQRNPDKVAARRRKDALSHLYGLSLEGYDNLLDRQGRRCAICGTEDPGGNKYSKHFHVDHDHSTGKIRGLLCNKCNRALGQLGDTVEALEKALNYLKKATNV